MPGGGAGAHRAPTLRATRVAARRSRVPPHSTELMEVATWLRGRRLGTFEENDAAAWPRVPAAGRSTRPCFAAPSRGANTSVAMSDREPRIIARDTLEDSARGCDGVLSIRSTVATNAISARSTY